MRKEEKTNGLNRITLFFGILFFFAVNHILTVSIPLLINDRGYGLEVVGYCTAGMGAMTILMKFLTPKLIDNVKLRILAFIDISVLSLSSLLFLFFDSSLSIIVLRTIFGAPFSLFPVLNLVIISRFSESRNQIVKTTSIIGMAMPISMMVSPIITELLLEKFQYRTVFFAAFMCSLLCIVFYMSSLRVSQTDNYKREKDSMNLGGIPLNILLPIIAFFFLGVVDMLMLSYFPIVANEQGKTYSFFFTIFAVAMVVSQYLYPRISLPNKYKLFIGYTTLGLSVLFTAICKIAFFPFAITSALLLGLGYSLVETTTNTLVMGKNVSSSIITIQQLSICLGRTIGPYFVSFFSSSMESLRHCFLIISLIQVVPIILVSFTRETETNK